MKIAQVVPSSLCFTYSYMSWTLGHESWFSYEQHTNILVVLLYIGNLLYGILAPHQRALYDERFACSMPSVRYHFPVCLGFLMQNTNIIVHLYIGNLIKEHCRMSALFCSTLLCLLVAVWGDTAKWHPLALACDAQVGKYWSSTQWEETRCKACK